MPERAGVRRHAGDCTHSSFAVEHPRQEHSFKAKTRVERDYITQPSSTYVHDALVTLVPCVPGCGLMLHLQERQDQPAWPARLGPGVSFFDKQPLQETTHLGNAQTAAGLLVLGVRHAARVRFEVNTTPATAEYNTATRYCLA